VPVIDLPLDELRTYQGRNPRPADFDAYWDEALAELANLSSEVSLEAVEHPSPIAECFDLWFTGVGGARIYAKHLRPAGRAAGRAAGPGIVVFHGYSVGSPDWFELLPYVAQGYSVVAMDCRGQGGRSEDVGGVPGYTLHGHIVRGLAGKPQDLMYRSVFLDAVQATRILMGLSGVDPARIGVTGRSQGGALSLACAALEPRVKAAASVYPFLSDYLRVWELDLAEKAYEELRQFLRRFDPTHERVGDLFTRLGYIDVQHLASRIRANLLMVTGLMDDTCPPSTQFAAYNKVQSPKQMVLYPDYGHENLPGANDRILAFFASAL
jgi:cephalosporin-C deacetylase